MAGAGQRLVGRHHGENVVAASVNQLPEVLVLDDASCGEQGEIRERLGKLEMIRG